MTRVFNHPLAGIRWVALWLLLQAPAIALAQQASAAVEGVKVDGRDVPSAEVDLMPPAKKDAPAPTPQKARLTKGMPLSVGTEIRTPPRTQVTLRSGANLVVIEPSTRLMIQQVGAKGDLFTLTLGKALFVVNQVTSVFNVGHKDQVAQVKGTRYSMEVVPGQSIRYVVQEGSVRVEQQRAVKISDAEQSIPGVRVSQLINQGSQKEIRIGAGEYLETFKTYRDAEGYFRTQLDQALRAKDAELIDEARYNLGTILTGIGKPREALPVLNAGLSQARKDDDQENIVYYLLALGEAQSVLSNYDKASELFEQAIAVLEEHIDPELESTHAADAHMALGSALYEQGRFAAALANFQYAATVLQDHLDEEPDSQLAQLYIRIGATQRRLGKKDASWTTYETATRMLQALSKAKMLDALEAADALLKLGIMRGELDDHAGALRDANNGLRRLQTLFPDRPHPLIARAYRQIGVEHSYLGDNPRGLEFIRKSLDMFNQLFPGGVHAELPPTYTELGRLTSTAGDPAQAAQYHQKALDILLKRHPDGLHPDIARAYWHLSLVVQKAGNAQQAAAYKQRYQRVRQQLRERDAADAAAMEADE